jgi:16S rRNA C967 or C1407 C5-methylase (RsmB/RsmF family)
MNMLRQRRILASSAECVAPGGYLLYTTCTYSREENEKNAEWLLGAFPQFSAQEIPHLSDVKSTLTKIPCYRIEPQHGLGAGGFSDLFRKQ